MQEITSEIPDDNQAITNRVKFTDREIEKEDDLKIGSKQSSIQNIKETNVGRKTLSIGSIVLDSNARKARKIKL